MNARMVRTILGHVYCFVDYAATLLHHVRFLPHQFTVIMMTIFNYCSPSF